MSAARKAMHTLRAAIQESGGMNTGESSKSQLQSASRRHREKLNSALEELGSLLPLPEDVKSKLDKLSVLKLAVSFFQTKNFVTNKKQRRSDCIAAKKVQNILVNENIGMSDITLEALDSMFIVFTETGDVFYVSENVKAFFGYIQTYLIHQNFERFVHPEDANGFKRCLQRPEKKVVELCREFDDDVDKVTGRKVCFCSIRCHAGRQSSHVSPFYYRSFKFDGHVRPLVRTNGSGTQYGYFALCTPVNRASLSTSTPREILQYYGCKMGLDLKLHKLDGRGMKIFMFSESEYMEISGYFFVNLDDISIMKLTHEQLMHCGQSTGVFRLMTASGKYQWVKGRARTVYDKHGNPEFIHADNIILGEEDGPFYKSVQWEILSKWSADKAANKNSLTVPPKQVNCNAVTPSNSERSGCIVDNASSVQEQVSPVSSAGIKSETMRRNNRVKEIARHTQHAVRAASPDKDPESIVTSMVCSDFRIQEDAMPDLQRALAGEINGDIQFEPQCVEDEVNILKSLLVEDNNNGCVAPEVGNVLNGGTTDIAALDYAFTGDTSTNARCAALEFSEQLNVLKSYLMDVDQNTGQNGFKASFQSQRPHPYSNHRKDGTKLSSDQEGMLWTGHPAEETPGCSYGVITANISPMMHQTRPQTQLLSNSPPSLAFLPATAPHGVSWDAPIGQEEGEGGSVRLTHLDSPPEMIQGNSAAMNVPISLQATDPYTGGSAVHLGSVASRPLSTDFFLSCGPGANITTTSSTMVDNSVNQKRAQVVANGMNGFNCQTSGACRDTGSLRHESRVDRIPPNWSLDPAVNPNMVAGCMYSQNGAANSFLSKHPQHAIGNPTFSSTQTTIMTPCVTGLLSMEEMSGSLVNCGEHGGTYSPPMTNGYSLPTAHPMHQKGTYDRLSHHAKINGHRVVRQNGMYHAPGQRRVNHQNGSYSPPRVAARPGQQNYTQQPYQGGSNLATTNGFIQSPQTRQPYQNTGLTCLPNSFSGSDVIPYGQFGPTVQGTVPYMPRESLRGLLSDPVPLSKTTHG